MDIYEQTKKQLNEYESHKSKAEKAMGVLNNTRTEFRRVMGIWPLSPASVSWKKPHTQILLCVFGGVVLSSFGVSVFLVAALVLAGLFVSRFFGPDNKGES